MHKLTLLNTVYEKLMEGEADIAAGNVVDAYTSLGKLREKYGLYPAAPSPTAPPAAEPPPPPAD